MAKNTASEGPWRVIGVLVVFAAFGTLMVFVPYSTLIPVTGGVALVACILFVAMRVYLQRIRVLRESETTPEVVEKLQRREDKLSAVAVGIGLLAVCAVMVMLALLVPEN